MPARKKPFPKGVSVHATYKTHGPSEKYFLRPPFKRSKTVVFESDIKNPEMGFTAWEIRSMHHGIDHQNKSRIIFLKKAADMGKKVLAGGEPITDPEHQFLKELLYNESPSSLEDFKEQARWIANDMASREKHVVETIKKSPKPVEIQYGSNHSFSLTKRLMRQGLRVKRQIQPQVFSWGSIVERKLLAKIKPTELDYKRGFVSNTLSLMGTQPHKNRKREWETNDSSLRLQEIIKFELVGRLDEPTLNQIINEKNPSLVFTANGLPENPTKKDLIQFLNKHSFFWKRQQKAEREKKLQRAKRK